MKEPYVYRGSIYRDPESLRAWLAGSPPEEPLEPDLPIIDPHHHLWETPQRGRYLLHDLVADLAECGHRIERTIFAECEAMYRAEGDAAMRPLGEVEFVRGMAAMSASGKYGPTHIAKSMIGHADLTLGAGVRAVLEAEIEAAAGRLVGIRHSGAWDRHDEIRNYLAHQVPPQLLLAPAFREGLAELAGLGLTFESWIFFHQLTDLIDLARAFPETTMIINHVGGPICIGPYAGQRAEIFEVWRRDMITLAACPNVHVKLGGLGMLHFGFGFHLRDVPPSSEDLASAWRPYIETSIEAFGVDRAMFESNFPVDKQSCRYGTLWNAFKRIASGATAEEKAALFKDTAQRVYRMG